MSQLNVCCLSFITITAPSCFDIFVASPDAPAVHVCLGIFAPNRLLLSAENSQLGKSKFILLGLKNILIKLQIEGTVTVLNLTSTNSRSKENTLDQFFSRTFFYLSVKVRYRLRACPYVSTRDKGDRCPRN